MPRETHPQLFQALTVCLQILAAPLPSEPTDPQPPDTPSAVRSPMGEVWALARRVAPLDSTILITGESGVGKERLARSLHEQSRRAQGPFVAVNCGALAETLVESELFGHARGAFTGAVLDRPGLFEAAHGGTLLLDEVGELSLPVQVKLLRVIQEREVVRLGERRPRAVDLRLIAATNRPLLDAVEEGRFRHDLYYRLHVIHLHIPPLRERFDELVALTDELLAETAQRVGRPVVGYTPAARERLLDYTWPGNIRELQHAIESACAIATGPLIDIHDLPESVRGRSIASTTGHRQPLIDRQHAYIRAVLDRHHGNRRRAAEELGMSVSTLKRRLRDQRRAAR